MTILFPWCILDNIPFGDSRALASLLFSTKGKLLIFIQGWCVFSNYLLSPMKLSKSKTWMETTEAFFIMKNALSTSADPRLNINAAQFLDLSSFLSDDDPSFDHFWSSEVKLRLHSRKVRPPDSTNIKENLRYKVNGRLSKFLWDLYVWRFQ